MTNYWRIMLGRKSIYAQECLAGDFIGVDFDIHKDLTETLPDDWRSFNKQYIPEFMANVPGKSKIAAGLACGMLWTVARGIAVGDVLLCPDGSGHYRVGTVDGSYYYAAGELLPHRRHVRWSSETIARSAMSDPLKRSTGAIGTCSDISIHAAEITALIKGDPPTPQALTAHDPDVEDPFAFAMERHLEDFLVANWSSTQLGSEFVIFQENGEPAGQQYRTDAGIIDILAISNDQSRLLVVELKRGRATDVVVGQVMRYMGFVKEQLAEPHQVVEGVIIGLEDDQKLRWALAAAPSIKFFRYEINFRLIG